MIYTDIVGLTQFKKKVRHGYGKFRYTSAFENYYFITLLEVFVITVVEVVAMVLFLSSGLSLCFFIINEFLILVTV